MLVAVKLEKTDPGVAIPFVRKLPGRGVADEKAESTPEDCGGSIGALKDMISSDSSDRSPASDPENSESKLSVDSSSGGLALRESPRSSAV